MSARCALARIVLESAFNLPVSFWIPLVSASFSELGKLYRDLYTDLPPLGVSFREYALACEEDCRGIAAAGQSSDEDLTDLPPSPALPLSAEPSALSNPRFVRRELCIARSQWQAIAEKARCHDLSLSSVLASAFAEVLSFWSGQDQLTVGFISFDRQNLHSDIHRILGNFARLIPLPFTRQPEWLAGVERVKQHIVRASERGSPSSLPVVFSSTLDLPDDLRLLAPPFGVCAGGLSRDTRSWFNCHVMEREGELSVKWDTVDEIFPSGVLDAMFGSYRRLIEWLATPQIDWRSKTPDLLPPEQRAVRNAVNSTAAILPGPAPSRRFLSARSGASGTPRAWVVYGPQVHVRRVGRIGTSHCRVPPKNGCPNRRCRLRLPPESA